MADVVTEKIETGETHTEDLKPIKEPRNRELDNLKKEVKEIIDGKEWSVGKLRKINTLVTK
jgi:hypothetical protein